MEILTFCCSIVLLAFDIIFLDNPYRCIFDHYISYSCDLSSLDESNTLWSFSGSSLSINTYKIPAIKGQLGGAVLMLATALLYIVLYIVTVVRVRRSPKLNRSPMPPQYPTAPLQQQKQFYHIPETPYFQQQQQHVSNPQYYPAPIPQYPVINERTEYFNSHHAVSSPFKSTKF